MKLAFLFSTILTALCVVISVAATQPREGELFFDEEIVLDVIPSPEPSEEINVSEPVKMSDELLLIRVKTDECVIEMSLRDYLPGVVSAEVPVSFEEEAIKAQTVTARTYALYRVERGGAHEDADVCTDPAHCSAWNSDAALKEKWGEDYEKNLSLILNAVDATDNMVVKYEGELIDAVFHSTSSGRTEASVDVWGAQRPYLVSVESPGEELAPRYSGKLEIEADRVKKLLESGVDGLGITGSPETWFSSPVRSDAGSVMTVSICGVAVKGSTIRSLLGLNSSNFTVSSDGDKFIFTTVGYGHGVGMSQFGANAMAKEGKNYIEILCHYYSFTAVEKYDHQKGN